MIESVKLKFEKAKKHFLFPHIIFDQKKNAKSPESGKKKKWASCLHRTATTTYPCSDQGLGDSAGAGRIRLARCKVNLKIVDFMFCVLSSVF